MVLLMSERGYIMFKKLVLCSFILGCSLALAMDDIENPMSPRFEAAARAYRDHGLMYDNPCEGTALADSYQALIGYGTGLLLNNTCRTSHFSLCRSLDRAKAWWCWGASAVVMGGFAGSLRVARSIKNEHLYAATVAASTLAAGFCAFILKPGLGLYFSPAEKVRRRALLDGFRAIQALQPLSSEQVAELEAVFATRVKEKRYADDDCILPTIDERVLELLACAKNNQGRVVVSADLEQQKNDEEALREQFALPAVAPCLEAIDLYINSVNRCHTRAELTPYLLGVSYVGLHLLTKSMPHGCLRTGMVLGGTLLSSLVSSRLTQGIFRGLLSFDWVNRRFETNDVKNRRIEVDASLRALTPVQREAVEKIYTFGQRYGYIPGGYRGGWSEALRGCCKQDCAQALTLIREVSGS
jgi:hypothetical protein